MKIGLVYEFLSEQGGLEREIINHANFLKEQGHDVEILTCHVDKEILNLLPFEGLKVSEISVVKTPSEALNLALCFLGVNKIVRFKKDAYLSYSFPSNFLIRKMNGKKIFYMNHFPHFLYLEGNEKEEWAKNTIGIKRRISIILSYLFGNYLKKLDKKMVNESVLKFTNSKFTKKRLDSLYNIKTIVSYPPLDPRFKPSKKIMKEKFIFSSSRIIPDKKYEYLISSISLMKKRLPLYLAGSVDLNYKRDLTSLAKEKGVKIKFLGRLTTDLIRDYYTNASVFAFPTPGEDFGLVPAESLSCGTPCVVWGDGAGPTEQINDGVNGFLAKPIDFGDFARKLDKIILTNFKNQHKEEILKSSRQFSAEVIKKDFVREIESVLK